MPSADQLIYTRATGNYSPVGQEGYQVVHKSAGLTDADIQQITPLVEGVPNELRDQRRYQFFRLADRRVVISLTGVVPGAPKISDPHGRAVSLAHVFVLAPEDFTDALQNDPFELLNQGEVWVTSPQEMARRFARQGTVAAAEVGRDPEPYATRDPLDLGWQPQEWKSLVALARNAAELVKAGKTVFFRGSPDDAAEVLRPLLKAVRTKKRTACTFDTACIPENYQSGLFWAVAGVSPPTGADCVEVDLDTKQVQLEGLKLDLGSDPYERWVTAAVESRNPGKVTRFGAGIEVLADILASGGQLEKSDLDAALLREFYTAFAVEVETDLRRRLDGWLTKRLADGLMGDLKHAIKIGSPPWWLSQTESEAGLCDWLAEWIGARAQPALGRVDRTKLRELGARPGARALAFWGLSIGFWPKHSAARGVLGEMTDAEFATAARLLGHMIPAARFVHAKHLPALVAALDRVVIPEKELLSAISAVLREGNPKVLDPLARRVAGLSAAGLQRLGRELTAAGATDTSFARAVANRMAPQSPDRFPTVAQPG